MWETKECESTDGLISKIREIGIDFFSEFFGNRHHYHDAQ
jgi:hypothetical protein